MITKSTEENWFDLDNVYGFWKWYAGDDEISLLIESDGICYAYLNEELD